MEPSSCPVLCSFFLIDCLPLCLLVVHLKYAYVPVILPLSILFDSSYFAYVHIY